MNLGFGFAQSREDSLRQTFLPVRQVAAIDHLGDVVQVAMGVLGLVLDRDLRGAKPFFLTSVATSRQPAMPKDSTAEFTAASSTPASTSAPSVMSPLIPLRQSR